MDYAAPILIVDDHQTMRDVTKAIISKLGFERIDQASDGDTALRMLRATPVYQLVISDLQMAPMTGLQLLRAIRQDFALKHIRFLLMTASAELGPVLAGKQAGADAYLLKPFTPQKIRNKIEEMFSRPREVH